MNVVRAVFGLCVSFVAANVCIAGSYELTQGGEDVCNAYRRNLEPRHDEKPMACERQYDPAVRGFAPIPWRSLDVAQNLDLYRQARIYLATHNFSAQGATMSEPAAREAFRDVSGAAQHLQVELRVATLDLGKDRGGRVNLLQVRERACSINPGDEPKISRLFVLDASLKHIDRLRQVSLKDWHNNATLVSFQGTIYIEAYAPDDNWAHLLTGSGELHIAEFAVDQWPSEDVAVDEQPAAAPAQVCVFRFMPTQEPK